MTKRAGHAFVSYVREDARHVDQMQRDLEAGGIPVWRDTADLWPGEDWRSKIRSAITDNALVFIACFSHDSVSRAKSYQNEELTLALEQLRLRRPGSPWLIPVRFDDCVVPDLDIGSGRTLASIQRANLFGNQRDRESDRLLATIRRLLGHEQRPGSPAPAKTAPVSPRQVDYYAGVVRDTGTSRTARVNAATWLASHGHPQPAIDYFTKVADDPQASETARIIAINWLAKNGNEAGKNP
jgi:hypothetical protein